MEGERTNQETMEESGGVVVGNGGIVEPSLLSYKEASEKKEFVKGVRGFAPPPFLTKTFKMVEDPETNNMISWNSEGTSLIVHDHLKFAMEVLPKYFRHSNFSSFIYQLNNYGFRKIGLRQYEYENKWFLAGQEHLLVNIKRRNDEDPTIRKKRGPKKQCFTAERSEMEAKLENVEDNINSLKIEITKLKDQMGQFESLLATFKQNLKKMESKLKELIMFLARIFSLSLVEKISQRVDEEQELESHETAKRRRVIAPQCFETSAKSMDVDNTTSQGVNGKSRDDQEANTSIRESKQSDDLKMWKKFMEDDSVSENESEQELLKNQSKIDMAFDELMVSKIVNAKEASMDVEDEVTLELWA